MSIRRTANILYVWMLLFFHLCFLLPRLRQPWPSCSCHVLVPSVFTEAQLWMQRSINTELLFRVTLSRLRKYREGISPQLRTCLETQDRLSSQPHKSNDCCSVLYDLFWKSKSVQIAWRHVCRVLLQFYFFFFHHSSSVTSCLCYLSTAIFHCLWFCIVSFEHNRPTCCHFTPRSWTFIRAYRNRSKIEREIP